VALSAFGKPELVFDKLVAVFGKLVAVFDKLVAVLCKLAVVLCKLAVDFGKLAVVPGSAGKLVVFGKSDMLQHLYLEEYVRLIGGYQEIHFGNI
jgi:hypothetical protein